MKTGWLVVNHYLQTEKFTELYSRFCRSAKARGIRLLVKTGAELLCDGSSFLLEEDSLPDFVLFWDKDIRLAYAMENMGIRLFNSAKSIFLCDDKSMTHLTLAGRVPMPKTICAPMTYPGVGYDDLSFVKDGVKALGLPLVIKECFGSFGAQVYLVQTEEEAMEKTKSLAGTPFIMQEYVESSYGRDLRLQVVGDKVVCAMERKNERDFRANVSNGGSMEAFTPTGEQAELALAVCRYLGLDFAGVDLLFGRNGKPLLCEVNSNAHFKNISECTGVDVADCIMAHIEKSLEENE